MSERRDIQNIYNEIFYDEEILERYREIEKFEDNQSGWAYHNFDHIKNVIDIVDKILRGFHYEEDFIYKAKIACLLHDVGAISGKDNHAYRSYEFAMDYFRRHNIKFALDDLVLEAIKIHSDGFETDNMIALSLILADKLDVKKTRISDAGMRVIGNRQYGHILDVLLDIENGCLKVQFLTDGNLDLKEVNDYYFTKKIFRAVGAFSDKLNLEYFILLDGVKWEIVDR